MGTFLVFLAGILFLAGIIFIRPRAKQNLRWKTVLNWVLYVLWYSITAIGVSFIYINSIVGHVKATSTAILLCIGLSIILAIVLARLLGLLGKKRENINPSAKA